MSLTSLMQCYFNNTTNNKQNCIISYGIGYFFPQFLLINSEVMDIFTYKSLIFK